MNPGTKSSGTSLLGVGALAALACAACCIGPILAFLGWLGALTAIDSLWVPALAGITVLALAAMAWAVHRRRRAAACASALGPVDLGLPTTPPPAARNARLGIASVRRGRGW